MCEKAVEIQKLWRDKIRTTDNYCKKGDYEDDFSRTVNLGGMEEEEIEELISNNVWLPRDFNIQERIFRDYGLASIRKLVEDSYGEYLSNEERVKRVKEYFKGDEIMNVLALMFAMEKYYNKRWDYKNEEWIEIKR